MYKWVFSERLKLSGDEHRRIYCRRHYILLTCYLYC